MSNPAKDSNRLENKMKKKKKLTFNHRTVKKKNLNSNKMKIENCDC